MYVCACVSVHVCERARVLHTCRKTSYMRRQWPCSGWRDSPIRQINCVRPGPWNSLRFPRPTTGHFTLDLATETIVPRPRFFFHRIFLHLPRVTLSLRRRETCVGQIYDGVTPGAANCAPLRFDDLSLNSLSRIDRAITRNWVNGERANSAARLIQD